ncbi:DUF6612 family protein [Oceanobacillus bengalensis]|uniref:LppX_LprAFG lipoprotein n=1 Tax=Oceanobacillus bengalensis TaxID=1435466 RepID=A0A494YRD1_9BACI|nr:DUF6612 family protein [Oceanobacillus bengalensis]RKQ11835.1 hypothetical protein D8M05_19215 [Oceanobacillus bengalensis]
MKKLVVAFGMILLSISLVACGNENAEDVFTQAMEAAEGMESAEVVIDMTQNIGMPDESSSLEMETNMEAEMILDPLAMYQKGTVSMMMDDFPMEMETEMYLVDDEVYVYDSMSSQWMKMDETMMPMDALNNQQPNITEQLEMFEKYVEEFEFEETEDEFVFKLTADGEGFTELTNQLMDEYMSEELTAQFGEEMDEVLESMDVSKLYIELYIDNETYEMNGEKIDMEMTMGVEGDEVKLSQQVSTKYTNINTIQSIEIPQEVKDNAVDGMGL